MPPVLCEKSVRNEVSPVSTVSPEVLPKTVLALSPPEVRMPFSKLSSSRLRLLRSNSHTPPSKTRAPAATAISI
ncbi:MAG TPA: hypothetical protein VFX01_07855, partial [Methylophilaceae bacterium]|nr:hypothetical protein [Methylophilaceae bacterium]